jgi:putative peptidoglycan lipid II flippase
MVAGQTALGVAAGRPRAALLRASVLLLVVAGLSKLTTLAADSFVAARFGLSADADAYLLALGLLGALLAAPSETVRLALVPVCGGYLRAGRRRDAAGVLVWLLILVAAMGIAGGGLLAFAAPWVARAVAPGFDDAAFDTLVLLTRVLAIALLLGLLMAVLTGALHTQLRFSAPAVAGIGLAAGVIGGGVLLGGSLGVTALAIGYVVGSAAIVAMLAWLCRGITREGVALRDRVEDLRGVLALALPTGLAISMVSAGAVIERAIASATGAGNVAALGFAIKLMTQAGIVAQSIWTPLTPLLTAAGPRGEAREGQLVAFSLRLVLLILVPATALLVALRGPLVALLFQRGAFDSDDTAKTATLLALHSGSLVGEALFMVSVAALLSVHDAATRLVASGLLIAVKLALGLSLAPLIGVAGVALAASVSSIVAGVYAVSVLSRRFGGGELRGLATFGARIGAAGLVALGAASACSMLVAASAEGGVVENAMRLVAGGAGGVAAYSAGLLLLRVDEAQRALAIVRGQVPFGAS